MGSYEALTAQGALGGSWSTFLSFVLCSMTYDGMVTAGMLTL